MKSKSAKTLIRTVTIFILAFICINSVKEEMFKFPTQKLVLGFLTDLSNSKNGSFIFIILI